MHDDTARSALAWWALAGVDTLVDERPRDWLAPQAPSPRDTPSLDAPRAALPADPVVAPSPPPAALPDTLDAFTGWWLAHAALPGAPAQRVAPAGPPASGLMLVVDMPEPEDAAAGRLLATDRALLFDRMLAAIGRDRESVYLASLWPARPAGGLPDKVALPRLVAVLRHHIALVAPRRLLLIGQGPVEALTGLDVARARGRVHDIAGIPAVVTSHPRSIANRAALKAAAWADLLLFSESDPAA